MGQQLGEDPNNFAAPSDQFTMGTTNTTQVLNNSVSPTTSVTSAVIVDRPPISGGSTAGMYTTFLGLCISLYLLYFVLKAVHPVFCSIVINPNDRH